MHTSEDLKKIGVKFVIYTPYGNTYFVNHEGLITTKQCNFMFSGSWKFVGLVSVKSNYRITFADLSKETKPDLLYKNGNPKYTVRDLDHGTTREWGNSQVHGVNNILFL